MHNFHEGDRNLSGKHNAKSRKRKLFVQGERKQQCHGDRSAKVNQASAFPCAPQGNDCSQLWLIHPGMGSWNPAFSPNWCVLNKLLLRELPCPTTQEPLWLSHLHHLSWERGPVPATPPHSHSHLKFLPGLAPGSPQQRLRHPDP